MHQQRIQKLRAAMATENIDVAVITDDDSVYYFSGYHDYLHMPFGRPTILIVPRDDQSLLITPAIDLNSAIEYASVDRIEAWNDGMGEEWREHLPRELKNTHCVAVESQLIPPLVYSYISSLLRQNPLIDLTPIIAEQRMIKSAQEIQLARHAGQVAMAMMAAGQKAIFDGAVEYEVAIATSEAGTKKSAQILKQHYPDSDISPNTHFLQIMASGKDIVKTHHRASRRVMRKGDPVFLCFCGMTNFHRFKLGFDRTFWIGEIQNSEEERIYKIALASQKAALSILRPGIAAEEVHAAYADVIQTAGFEYPFRCGRGTGFSYLEKPQLVAGDKTILKANMVLAVDGSVSTDSFRAQVGDSVILCEGGFEAITSYVKETKDVIVPACAF